MSDIEDYEQKLKRKLEFSESQQKRNSKLVSMGSKEYADDDYESYQQYILGSSKIDKNDSMDGNDKEYDEYIDAIIQKNYKTDDDQKDPDLIDIKKIHDQSNSDMENENMMFEQNYQKFQQSQIVKTNSQKNNDDIDDSVGKVLSKANDMNNKGGGV